MPIIGEATARGEALAARKASSSVMAIFFGSGPVYREIDRHLDACCVAFTAKPDVVTEDDLHRLS